MGKHRKKDGTTTIKGADGRITDNVAAAALAGPKRVEALVQAYVDSSPDHEDADWSALGDLVADILHYADRLGPVEGDGERVARMAMDHYLEEREEVVVSPEDVVGGVDVTIVYRAFARTDDQITEARFTLPDLEIDRAARIPEILFEATNLQTGELWNYVKGFLPAGRTHTSISVGDVVRVAGVSWHCDRIGWTPLPSADPATCVHCLEPLDHSELDSSSSRCAECDLRSAYWPAGDDSDASVRAAAETGDWRGFFDSLSSNGEGLTDEERRIRELEDEGIPTSDAQAIAEAEALLARERAPEETPELEPWMGPTCIVTNDSGRKFTVRYIPVGGYYGRADVLVNEKEPMIAFYDASYASPAWPLGQFVSNYYVSTLQRRPANVGLCLDGGSPDAWSLSAENVRDAVAFAEEQLRA